MLLWGDNLEVGNAVVVLEVVAVVDVEVAWWKWSVGVVGVVNCKLPVEVGCGDGVAALAGLLVTELEVETVPGDTNGGSKDGVRGVVGGELGWVWVPCSWFGGVGER